ncbi:MAG: hypothetical protein ACYDHH_25680 [Solirubrobacteraceae bacterium]
MAHDRVEAEVSAAAGVFGWDPLRIVVNVRGPGCTDYEVADARPWSADAPGSAGQACTVSPIRAFAR